ncbi:hypothetical protein GWK47_028784 [Chionoecetes opilio]|uniref:Uncharacterized protein n=1 Tax=Chionoecetes opilio TaxID=41210 RepID=A0A8J5CRU7_CHIOP|nr:hypothetical protein GWK47_028784 [Chionoecetes opilio]
MMTWIAWSWEARRKHLTHRLTGTTASGQLSSYAATKPERRQNYRGLEETRYRALQLTTHLPGIDSPPSAPPSPTQPSAEPPGDAISSLLQYLEDSRLSENTRRLQEDEKRFKREEERRRRDYEARRKDRKTRVSKFL